VSLREVFEEVLRRLGKRERSVIEMGLGLYEGYKEGLRVDIEVCSTYGILFSVSRLSISQERVRKDLEKLVADGLISKEEYDRLRRAIFGDLVRTVSESAREFEERCVAKK